MLTVCGWSRTFLDRRRLFLGHPLLSWLGDALPGSTQLFPARAFSWLFVDISCIFPARRQLSLDPRHIYLTWRRRLLLNRCLLFPDLRRHFLTMLLFLNRRRLFLALFPPPRRPCVGAKKVEAEGGKVATDPLKVSVNSGKVDDDSEKLGAGL